MKNLDKSKSYIISGGVLDELICCAEEIGIDDGMSQLINNLQTTEWLESALIKTVDMVIEDAKYAVDAGNTTNEAILGDDIMDFYNNHLGGSKVIAAKIFGSLSLTTRAELKKLL